jgi:hypothetical protein
MSVIQNLSKDRMLQLIEILTLKKANEIEAVKSEWDNVLHHLTVASILSDTLDVLSPPTTEKVQSVSNNIIGLSSSFLINKIFPKKPDSMIARVSKIGFELLAGKIIGDNADKIMSMGSKMIKKMIAK